MPAKHNVIAGVTAGGGTSGTGNRTVTKAASVGTVWIVLCNVSVNANTTPTCTDDNPDGHGTYTLIGTVGWNGGANTLSAFVRDRHLLNTTSTIVTLATGANDAGELAIVPITGAPYAGAALIRQFAVQANQTTGTTAAPAFGVAALTNNLTLAIQASDDTTSTAPASWSEIADASQATPTTALQVCYRDSGFTGTTVTWGATTTGNYCAMIIEFNGTGLLSTRAATSTNDTASSTTHTITSSPAVGDYWLVGVTTANDTSTPTAADDNGGTYSLVSEVVYNTNWKLSILVRDQLFTNTTSTILTVTTGVNDSCVVGRLALSGFRRVGLKAVVQSVSAVDSNSPTLAVIPQPGNMVIYAMGSTAATSPPAAVESITTDWQEAVDAGALTPSMSLALGYRTTGQNTTGLVTFTAGTPKAIILVELSASAAPKKRSMSLLGVG